MKLRDLVFRLSYLWGEFAVVEWNRNTGEESHLALKGSLSELEDYVAGEHWEIGWYDVVNVLPMVGGQAIKIVVARA